MHVILWRFRARHGRESEFEAAYGDDGPWARLFRLGEGYLGTELLRASDGAYLTIDRWNTREASSAFREAYAARIAEIDARCETMTIEESLIAEVDA